jgi:hypothetical protein
VVASGPAAVTGEVLALAAMAGGVWLVAHRTPQVTGGDGAAQEDGRRERAAQAARS